MNAVVCASGVELLMDYLEGVLPADVAAAPITGGPAEVAARVVAVARQVTADPTWLLVVLRASDADVLPPGVHDADPATPVRPAGELEQWAEIKAAASDALLAAGGTITHHHAVGRDHRRWYDRERPALFASALRAAKRELDPAGVLNPGVLFD